MNWLNWKRFGEVLEWLGIFYLVGFVLFGLVTTLVIFPRLHDAFANVGYGAVFGIEQQVVGPLLLFFVIISLGAWYQGHEIKTTDHNWYDKLVGVFLGLVLLLLGTPQLYQAVSSLTTSLR